MRRIVFSVCFHVSYAKACAVGIIVHGVGWGFEIQGTRLGGFEAGASGQFPQFIVVQDLVWIRCQLDFKSKSIALATLLGTD